jgi:hypothetical protein
MSDARSQRIPKAIKVTAQTHRYREDLGAKDTIFMANYADKNSEPYNYFGG